MTSFSDRVLSVHSSGGGPMIVKLIIIQHNAVTPNHPRFSSPKTNYICLPLLSLFVRHWHVSVYERLYLFPTCIILAWPNFASFEQAVCICLPLHVATCSNGSIIQSIFVCHRLDLNSKDSIIQIIFVFKNNYNSFIHHNILFSEARFQLVFAGAVYLLWHIIIGNLVQCICFLADNIEHRILIS